MTEDEVWDLPEVKALIAEIVRQGCIVFDTGEVSPDGTPIGRINPRVMELSALLEARGAPLRGMGKGSKGAM